MSGDATVGSLLLDAVSWICLVSGSVFCLIGGIGMVRMPDFYTRGHAAGLTDTLGAGLILVGLMFQAGVTLITAKLAIVLFFLYITSPTATHALFKSAYAGGMRWDLQRRDHHADRSEAPDAFDAGEDVSV
ncbi:MAG: monovalent cation/H(+) antiporter subunit G [bacterium]|nr:monovalent cation/H(+) antiporter subunit G [bacterium]